MATITFLFLLISAAVVVSCESVRIELDRTVKINPIRGQSKDTSGVVKGFRLCGGQGQLLQWRYDTCKESDTTCQAPADGSLRKAEVDFIPSRDISLLGLRLRVNSMDGEVKKEYNFDGPIINQGVKSGESYSITNAGGVTEELKGKLATFQYILYDKQSNEVEICAEAEFQYY